MADPIRPWGRRSLIRRMRMREALRNTMLWCVVLLALAVAYTFQSDVRAVALRVESAMLPSRPIATGSRTLIVSAAPDGHFYIAGTVNGAPVTFLIDTGASDIVLSPADAARAGLDPEHLRFDQRYETANGTGRGAETTISHLQLGPIDLTDIPVAVNRAAMATSLLGVAFLNRLSGYEVRGQRLILHW